MVDLLQKLWNEYSKLIDAADKVCEDMDNNEQTSDLLLAIQDTDDMADLRKELAMVGVRNIPGG